MRSWRNWQTRALEGRMGDRMGSSPIDRTNIKEFILFFRFGGKYMSKKILIAGAGHGGLTAGSYLAEQGYEVLLFEKLKESDLGFDWHDAIENDTFITAGVGEINKKDYSLRLQSTFWSPSAKKSVSFDVPPEENEWDVDRKIIYKYLLKRAKDTGVKLNFENNISDIILDSENNICGLIVNGKKITGDLIIDSCGIFSLVREKLPSNYSVNQAFKDKDIFYAFKGYYNLEEDVNITNKDRFNIYFMLNNLKGIAWFKITHGMADVLIGQTQPLSLEDVKVHLDTLRSIQPSIGNNLLRGGQILPIPIAGTFAYIVGNNYAAVGDCVSMPIPINGSGISNSILAGKILAETILDIDKSNNSQYTIDNLWAYQAKYYKVRGKDMASICVIKNAILGIGAEALDYFFENEVLTAKEFSAGASGKQITLGFSDILQKVKRGYKKLFKLLKIRTAVAKSAKIKEHCFNIPELYDITKIKEWAETYKTLIK